ncbi:unnamed protein product [Echinostoma caproni]|uniref:GOLGA2L5 domain-containing protein n=1 Tax=Echinostoma caproni TaxID=27848 RepID=A0A183AVM7_9TREM|nr:unnamed protein product [Echinostoma caproni]
MQPTISVEEFQRFQSQLLDLREAQIQATDARLRAESQAKQLEAEVAQLKTSLSAAQAGGPQKRVDQLLRDNAQLREKLLGTESAFQLQSSTLRAECLHLSSEVERLNGLLSKPRNEAIVQTEPEAQQLHAQVQTDEDQSPNVPRSPSPHPPSQMTLEAIQEVEGRIDALSGLLNSHVETKLSYLENRLEIEVNELRSNIAARDAIEASLVAELKLSKQCTQEARESEQELRNQLIAVKRRSEKLTRELRRQLARVLRATVTGESERSSLRKLSIYSSSSSLSSSTNIPGSLVNGEGSSRQQPAGETNDGSSLGQSDIPVGFFPMADFKVSRSTIFVAPSFHVQQFQAVKIFPSFFSPCWYLAITLDISHQNFDPAT